MMVKRNSLPSACSIVICLCAVGLFFEVFISEQVVKVSTILHHNKTQTTKNMEVGLLQPRAEQHGVIHEQHLDRSQQTPKNDEEENVQGNDSKKDLPKPQLHFCTEKVMSFDNSQALSLGYQCVGDHYDEFARALHSLAETLPEPIGRRDFPVSSDRTVLVMGNSHIRQMMTTLICQYRDVVVEFGPSVIGSMNATAGSANVRFANNSTIVSITNNPIVYFPDWVDRIERDLGRPLKSYDGIVLGRFNNQKSSPPTLRDVANVYDGPVVYVSMFAKYGTSQLTENREFIKSVNRTRRHNLSTIYGRKYIDVMKMECGAMETTTEGLCYEDSDKNVSRVANSMHRCVGAKGGHPDLISWEVVERLNTLWEVKA